MADAPPPHFVIDDPSELPAHFNPRHFPRLPPWASVFMVRPDYYDVVYAINPHMADAEGRPRSPDRELAREQWERLRKVYEALGYSVVAMAGVEGLPDMVFAANQVFAFPDATSGVPSALLAKMRHPERRDEIAHVAAFFRDRGTRLLEIPDGGAMEGGGDLLWYPGRRIILAGHGFRTERRSLEGVAAEVLASVVALELVHPHFYHLDTCLLPLNAEQALIVREAFDDRGIGLLERLFGRLIDVQPEEARSNLAANAHCPDGRHVIIDAGARQTIRQLRDEGFRVLPVDTSEFLKAGGSVFCLKTMLPASPPRSLAL